LKGQNLEEALRFYSRDNRGEISDDELLLSVSKLNANVYIGDIKDLARVLRGETKPGEKVPPKILIAEVI
jgi:Ca2+-binding EF-hand superfamily protein